VKRNADRLLRLITTILDFATAEAGRLTATFRPTHLGPFTVDLASVFRSAVERAGLQYIVDSSHVPADLVVWVDRDKYEKIVYNLLSNAHKYTLTGSVSISTSVDRTLGRFVLEVRDTGIGIPPEEIDDVFNKFHRVSLTRGRSVEGTGIGLSYTRELVRLHKGEITVESEMAQGSVFRACIPLGRDHLHAETVLEGSAPGDWSSTPVTPSLYFMVCVVSCFKQCR
jgi:signal transduction histidine kinase